MIHSDRKSAESMQASGFARETVVVLHGLGGHWLAMAPMVRHLRRADFQCVNWGYRSLWMDLDWHATRLRRVLVGLEADPSVDRFHIVAHSMGSIITRKLLQEFQPQKLARIVMLGPPNHGSHAATRLRPVLGWLCKTMTQIADAPDSFVNQLDPQIHPAYQVGIIQAETDYVVARPSTMLAGVHDYVVTRGLHSSMLLRPETSIFVIRFLKSGSFDATYSQVADNSES